MPAQTRRGLARPAQNRHTEGDEVAEVARGGGAARVLGSKSFLSRQQLVPSTRTDTTTPTSCSNGTHSQIELASYSANATNVLHHLLMIFSSWNT